MTPQVAQAVCIGFLVVGVAVWLYMYRLVSRIGGGGAAGAGELAYRDDASEEGGAVISGSADIPGTPEEVSTKIAEMIASGVANMPMKITERDERRLRFEPVGPAPQGRFFDEAEFTFSPSTSAVGHTRVAYRVDMSRFAGKLRAWGKGLLFLIGLPGAVVLPVMLLIFVAPHPDPGARWQVMQCLQMVHGLWPPILFHFIFKRARQMVASAVDAQLSNLEHM